ncbi:hypothetical protein AHMF7605_24775 [Adhaeribacter arboris]|uniref:Uncharacterized protein n=1 Tax=Adhaeribacter arboris TaxID=2072846 RepID=A0A2T2YLV9_9BACT|nr:hypothetical protein AHMF7605_24775 [Adhaeribacter arboris]
MPDEVFIYYLKKHSIPYKAFYICTQDRSVVQIQPEAALGEEIQEYLDNQQAIDSLQSLTRQLKIR